VKFVRMFWKSLTAGMFLLGLFWLPADVQSYSQALGPWQRLWALLDRETLLWIFALGLFAWLVWTDVRPFMRGRMAKKFPPRHAAVCGELAKQISTLREETFSVRHWAMSQGDLARVAQYERTLIRIDRLRAQIAYDQATNDAVAAFTLSCLAFVDAELKRQPIEAAVDGILELSGPLIESLHRAKPLNPDVVLSIRLPIDIEPETQQ
jgi:hypothetical protein